MTPKHGYKVVRRDDEGRLWSAVRPELMPTDWISPRWVALEYVPGEPTRPEDGCGPCLLFETLPDAQTFRAKENASCYGDWGYEVWECEYVEAPLPRYPRPLPWGLTGLPDGTVAASEVTLTTPVGDEE